MHRRFERFVSIPYLYYIYIYKFMPAFSKHVRVKDNINIFKEIQNKDFYNSIREIEVKQYFLDILQRKKKDYKDVI